MDKKLFFLLTSTLLASGCGKKNTFVLEGDIGNLPSDTIPVCYQVPAYKLDTIFADKGKFTYAITPDTFTVFSLLLAEEETRPIFADKGEKVTLSGPIGQLQVKGTEENERMAQILHCLGEAKAGGGDILATVDSLIKANPQSYTNLYLIDTYYARDTLPDYRKIDELAKGLSGIIKDTPYILALQEQLDELLKAEEARSVFALSCPDKDGKNIGWAEVKDKYVLLDFWASWEEESVAAQDSLKSVRDALKKEKFAIISLSLDMNRDDWLAACPQDTAQWKQACDFTGWNNAMAKQLGITRLPANVLLGPDKKIIARDIRGKEVADKVKELLASDKEKEKTAKAAEKARKKPSKN